MTALNLAPNPAFEDGLFGWANFDDDFTVTVQPSGGFDGPAFYRAVCDAAPGVDVNALLGTEVADYTIRAAQGQMFTWSVHVRGVGGGIGRTVWLQATATDVGGAGLLTVSQAIVLTAGWVRASVTLTCPFNTHRLSLLLFDWNGSAQTFAVGDTVDVDAVMVNEGQLAPYTRRHPPLRWAGGPNYDLGQLVIRTATPGFIIGEGIIGTSVLGPDSGYVDLQQTFTSLLLQQPCIVEQGLFVHREVDSLTVTTTDPDHLALKGKRTWVLYGPKTLFLGTVVETAMTEAVAVGADHLRGNTPRRTHRVTLRCSAGEEFFATQDAPPRAFSTETFTARLASYMGLTSTDLPPHADVDAAVMANLNNDLARRTVTTLADDPRTLMDTFRDLLKRCGRYYRYLPWASHIDSEGVSRVASGAATLAEGLRFTDNPDLTGTPSPAYGYRTHEERTVSYSERVVSEDPQLFATGVSVRATESAVETIHGPFLTAGTSRRQDVLVDLGEINNAGRVPQMIRNFVGTLPLKAKPVPFTSRIRAPLQSIHQLQQRIPGLATLNRTHDLPGEFTTDPTSNLIGNPSFETDASGWDAYGLGYGGGSIAQSSAQAWHGSKAGLVTWPTFAGNSLIAHRVRMIPGQAYTMSMYVYVPAGNPDVRATLGFTSSGPFTSVKDRWVRLSHTFTAPDSIGAHTVGVESAANTTAGQICYLDAVMVEQHEQLVGIVGVTHAITPDRWLLDYDCAPPHLFTRVGDFDPSPPRTLTGSQAGAGGAVTLNWLAPDSIPTTRPVYAQVRGITPPSNFVGGMEPSDNAMVVLRNDLVPPLAPRAPQQVVIPFASLSAAGWRFFVQYTTDQSPGDSSFDPTNLIGQPAILDLTLT